MNFPRIIIIHLLLLSLSGCSYFGINNNLSLARKAEAAQKEGDCDKAIEYYQLHIESRIEEDKKADKENPWFYLVKIGDCQLQQGKEEDALNTYLEAKSKKVYPDLIADRLMKIVDVRIKNKRYEQAVALLKNHREIDELKFDSRIDEIHKEVVANEEFPVKPVEPIER